MMQILIAILIFLVVTAAVLGIYALITIVERRIRQRQIRALLEESSELSSGGRQGGAGGQRPDTAGSENMFGKYLNTRAVEALLLSAGIAISAERFVFLVSVFLVLSFTAALALSMHVLLSILATLILAGIVWLYLLNRRRHRDEEMVQQLPDALDMIVRALKAGQSVDNALKEVANNCLPPLGTEIQIVYEEITLGIPFVTALRNLEARFSRIPDIKLMTTAFIIQRETGGSIAKVLGNLSGLIRQRDQLRRQIRAFTAEGRSSALILGLLPVAVAGFFSIVRPDYIRVLFDNPVGRKLVLLAVLLEVSGFFIMRMIIRINP